MRINGFPTSIRARARRGRFARSAGGRPAAVVAPLVAAALVLIGTPAMAAEGVGAAQMAATSSSAAAQATPAEGSEDASPPPAETDPAPQPEQEQEPPPEPGPSEPASPSEAPSPEPETEGGSDAGTGAPDAEVVTEPAPQQSAAPSPAPSPSPSPSEYGSQDLTLVKTVINDDQGDASASDWTLQASLDGMTWTTLPQNQPTPLDAGTYHLRETGGPAGYVLVGLECDSYSWDAAAMTITLEDGDHNTCTFTNDDEDSPADVGIVKTHSDLPDHGVEAGDAFTWFLEVTNHGATDAEGAVVSDSIPAGVTVVGVTVPSGWSDGSSGSVISVTVPFLASGARGVIEVAVRVDAPSSTPDAPFAPPGTTPPALGELPGDLVNTACVELEADADDSNDCSTDTVPRKAIVASVWVGCINEAPYLMYEVATTPSLSALPITMTWKPLTGGDVDPASVTRVLHSGDSGRVEWPGVVWGPDGVSVDWPGWRPLRDADFGPDGRPLPGLVVYGNSVRDTDEPDEAWRAVTEISFSVNPVVSYYAVYPAATPECAVIRPTAVLADTGGNSAAGPLGTLAVAALLGGGILLRASRRGRTD